MYYIIIVNVIIMSSLYIWVLKNMQFLFFWAWLILLNVIISSSIHSLVNNIISFFFIAE
jgi:hypothetical protein